MAATFNGKGSVTIVFDQDEGMQRSLRLNKGGLLFDHLMIQLHEWHVFDQPGGLSADNSGSILIAPYYSSSGECVAFDILVLKDKENSMENEEKEIEVADEQDAEPMSDEEVADTAEPEPEDGSELDDDVDELPADHEEADNEGENAMGQADTDQEEL